MAVLPIRRGVGIAEGYTADDGRHVCFKGDRVTILALRFALEDEYALVVDVDPSQVISIEPTTEAPSSVIVP